jgi:hypothetical protein
MALPPPWKRKSWYGTSESRERGQAEEQVMLAEVEGSM